MWYGWHQAGKTLPPFEDFSLDKIIHVLCASVNVAELHNSLQLVLFAMMSM